METPYTCSFGKPWRWVKGNISCYAFGSVAYNYRDPHSATAMESKGPEISELWMWYGHQFQQCTNVSWITTYTSWSCVLKALHRWLLSDLKCGYGAFRTSVLTSKVTTTSFDKKRSIFFPQREPHQPIVNCWLAGWCFSLFVIGGIPPCCLTNRTYQIHPNHWPENGLRCRKKIQIYSAQHLCVAATRIGVRFLLRRMWKAKWRASGRRTLDLLVQ